jgi:sRNA-binding regulator protein Hfq
MSHWTVTHYHAGTRHIQTLRQLSELRIYEFMKINKVFMSAFIVRGVKIKYNIPKFEIYEVYICFVTKSDQCTCYKLQSV